MRFTYPSVALPMWWSRPQPRAFLSAAQSGLDGKGGEAMRKGATAKLVSALLTGGLLVGVLMFKGIPVVKAHVLPSPCDFTTGGGFVLNNDGFFFFQAEDGIRDHCVTGVQTCALPI